MSEEQVKLIICRTVQFCSDAYDYIGWRTAEINYLPICINAMSLGLIYILYFVFVICPIIICGIFVDA